MTTTLTERIALTNVVNNLSNQLKLRGLRINPSHFDYTNIEEEFLKTVFHLFETTRTTLTDWGTMTTSQTVGLIEEFINEQCFQDDDAGEIHPYFISCCETPKLIEGNSQFDGSTVTRFFKCVNCTTSRITVHERVRITLL